MSFHQQKQFCCRNIIISTHSWYQLENANIGCHKDTISSSGSSFCFLAVWGKHLIMEGLSKKMEKKWWQTAPSFISERLEILPDFKEKLIFYGERIWFRGIQIVNTWQIIQSFQHNMPCQPSNSPTKNRLKAKMSQSKLRGFPASRVMFCCITIGRVWSQANPNHPNRTWIFCKMMSAKVGPALGIPEPQNHLRSCSSYSTHVCKL